MLAIDIPSEAEKAFREAWGNGLDRIALESMVSEGYRSGKFGISRVRALLGLESRWDAEAWLAEHGLHMNYGVSDLEADRRTIAGLSAESH